MTGARRPLPLAGLVALVVLVALAASCSWLLVSSPPPPTPAAEETSPWSEPPCTRSRTLPILDLLLALPPAFFAGGLIGQMGQEESTSADNAPLVGAIGFGVTAVAFGVSAWYGFRETGRCRQAYPAGPGPG